MTTLITNVALTVDKLVCTNYKRNIGDMNKKIYPNFVRPDSPVNTLELHKKPLTGTEAKKFYLEEINDSASIPCEFSRFNRRTKPKRIIHEKCQNFCEKELFLSVQNNDIHKLSKILDTFPDKINTLDSYGWSLLMIACQANAVDIVKELLKRRIDISVRDKAGNSATSLIIKNRNIEIADLLLGNKPIENKNLQKEQKSISVEEYTCEICNNKNFSNKQQHLASTLHNINVSKGKKHPTNYVIPESNKGYQIMLKGGWDKETGLGPDGSGKKYPIRAIKKTDKSGIGHKKVIEKIFSEALERSKTKVFNQNNDHANRIMEINFRRQFY